MSTQLGADHTLEGSYIQEAHDFITLSLNKVKDNVIKYNILNFENIEDILNKFYLIFANSRLNKITYGEEGKGILFNVGWPGHVISIFFIGDKLYRCNGGSCTEDAVIEIYSMQNIDNKQNVLDNLQCHYKLKNPKDYLNREIHQLLDLKLIDRLQYKDQVVGNCALYSQILGFLAMCVEEYGSTRGKELFESIYGCMQIDAFERYTAMLNQDATYLHFLRMIIIQKFDEVKRLPYAKQLQGVINLNNRLKDAESSAYFLYQTAELLSEANKGHSVNSYQKVFDDFANKFHIYMPLIERNDLSRKILLLKTFIQRDYRGVRNYFSGTPNPDFFVVNGHTPLHLAVQLDSVKLIKICVDYLKNKPLNKNWVHSKNGQGKVPLHYVKSIKTAELLIAHGAIIKDKYKDEELAENSVLSHIILHDKQLRSETASLIEYLLNAGVKFDLDTACFAAARDKPDVLEVLCRLEPSALKCRTHSGLTAAHIAAKRGKTENIQFLIRHVNSLSNHRTYSGLTPVMQAIKYGQHPVALMLFSSRVTSPSFTMYRGTNVLQQKMSANPDNHLAQIQDIANERQRQVSYYNDEYKPIMISISFKRPDQHLLNAITSKNIDALIGCILAHPAGTDIENPYFGMTTFALDVAVRHDFFEAVKAILELPAIYINEMQGKEHFIHVASRKGNIEIVTMFVSNLLALNLDVNIKTLETQMTPLHIAIENGHGAVVDILLASAKIDLSLTDSLGRTAFSIADDHPTFKRLFLETYSNLEKLSKIKTTENISAHTENFKYFVKYFKSLEKNKLLQNPLDLIIGAFNSRDKRAMLGALEAYPDTEVDKSSIVFSTTPLHSAASFGDIEVLKYMLGMTYSDINILSPIGEHLLHLAVDYNNNNILTSLLEIDDVDINAKDSYYGQTPLHYAAKKGNIYALEKILACKDVDVLIKDSKGKTAFDLVLRDEMGQLKCANHKVYELLKTKTEDALKSIESSRSNFGSLSM